METPTSSSRRITGSQSVYAARKTEEYEKLVMKSRSALIDITNDSPIVGLATGDMKTPSSAFYKKSMIARDDESKPTTTPGSGEALLRDQVQNLLQKVEEEAGIKKITFEPTSFVNSPIYLLAPTPANTPQFSENNSNASESCTSVSPVVEESFNFFQVDRQEEAEESVVTKLLFEDLPGELEEYDSSLDDEDDDSVWSVEANASTSGELEDEDDEFEVGDEDGAFV